jgi:hypothetical protein
MRGMLTAIHLVGLYVIANHPECRRFYSYQFHCIILRGEGLNVQETRVMQHINHCGDNDELPRFYFQPVIERLDEIFADIFAGVRNYIVERP